RVDQRARHAQQPPHGYESEERPSERHTREGKRSHRRRTGSRSCIRALPCLMSRISRTYRKLAVVACIAAVAVTLSACNGKKEDSPQPPSGPLPAAADLMSQASTAMSGVTTTHFALKVDGTLPNLPISQASGDLTKEGNAKGTATAQLLGNTVETKFIILG